MNDKKQTENMDDLLAKGERLHTLAIASAISRIFSRVTAKTKAGKTDRVIPVSSMS